MPMGYMKQYTYRLSRARVRRNTAAARIQRAWRRNRFRKGYRMARYKKFARRVNAITLRKDPTQYRLFSTNDTSATPDTAYVGISQTPIVLLNLSDLKFNNENTSAKYVRTAPKVKVMNMLLRMSILAQDSPFNRVSVALVRHKRTEPILNADIQAALGGALTTQNDKPFLPSTTATNNNTQPNDIGCNMTGLNPGANPFVLNSLGWNPKVVQVVKKWDVIVQPQWRAIAGGDTPTSYQAGQTYPLIREIEYNHSFNEVWKFPSKTSTNNLTESFFPYNNKCYSLIAFSDSVSGSSHPAISAHVRLSFKDLD